MYDLSFNDTYFYLLFHLNHLFICIVEEVRGGFGFFSEIWGKSLRQRESQF